MRQIHYFVDMKVRVSNYIDRMFAKYAPRHVPLPCLSMIVSLRGKDYYNCGPRYNTTYIQCTGLGTITDSLSSLRKHVFEDKTFTMEALLDAMADNFEGHEPMRQMILNRTPFFGNDDPYADQIAVRVFDDLYDASRASRNTKGECFHLNMLSTTCHVYFGKVMGSHPNGRLAGRAISDGTSPLARSRYPRAVRRCQVPRQAGSGEERRHAAEPTLPCPACSGGRRISRSWPP